MEKQRGIYFVAKDFVVESNAWKATPRGQQRNFRGHLIEAMDSSCSDYKGCFSLPGDTTVVEKIIPKRFLKKIDSSNLEISLTEAYREGFPEIPVEEIPFFRLKNEFSILAVLCR